MFKVYFWIDPINNGFIEYLWLVILENIFLALVQNTLFLSFELRKYNGILFRYEFEG